MRSRIKLVLLVFLASLCGRLSAQPKGYDVFIPIGKYIVQGDAESLSSWFADNLEVSILANEADASREQARQIVKSFFDTYTPSAFNITHTAGRANMKYALATLNAGGDMFMITIFVCSKGDDRYRIQQFKIERLR